MERIRIGSGDIAISWAVYDIDGLVHDFSDKELELYMACGGYKVPVTGYTIQDNVLSWVFKQEKQTKTGDYKLILVERVPDNGGSVVCVERAFRLTPEDLIACDIIVAPYDIAVRSIITYSSLVGVASVDVVESDDDEGNNIVSIILNNGHTVQFTVKNGSKGDKGDKGDQGNSGYQGAAGELEVVNNLTDGGETAALSAEMGKRLKGLHDDNVGRIGTLERISERVYDDEGYVASDSESYPATIAAGGGAIEYENPDNEKKIAVIPNSLAESQIAGEDGVDYETLVSETRIAALRGKVDGIAEGAQANVIESLRIQGAESDVPVSSKKAVLPVDSVPTGGSKNLVLSGVIAEALSKKVPFVSAQIANSGIEVSITGRTYIVCVDDNTDHHAFLVNCGDDYTNATVTALSEHNDTQLAEFYNASGRLLIWSENDVEVTIICVDGKNAPTITEVDNTEDAEGEINVYDYAKTVQAYETDSGHDNGLYVENGALVYRKDVGGVKTVFLPDALGTNQTIGEEEILITAERVAHDLLNYYTKSQTYTKTEVQNLIGAIQQFHYEIYPTLPATGAGNVLYLIGPTGTGSDRYEEYVYANGAFTKIGDTTIDLSGYSTTEQMIAAINAAVTAALETVATKAALEEEVSAREASEASIKAEVAKKANTDGYYGGMTVGSAENLVGRGSVEAEYQGIRTSAGSEDIGVGAAMIREMRGKSIVWNQLCSNTRPDFSRSGISITNNGDGSFTVNAEDTHTTLTFDPGSANNIIIEGHKYYLKGCPAGGSNQTFNIRYNSNGFGETGNGIILTCDGTGTTGKINIKPIIVIQANVSGSFLFRPQLFDLTLMFGSTVADALTVEDCERMFPLPYYEYNPGTIINNSATGIKTVGFNLYNHATGKAVLPGKYSDYPYEYEICGAFESISFEDYAGNVTTPELYNGRFFNVPSPGVLTVVGGNATDTLVHLVWSGWRNYGEPDYAFEAYWENILQLNLKSITGKLNGEGESVLVYPEGMRGAGSAYDYLIVDADGYARRAVRVMESVDLGMLTWSAVTSTGTVQRFRAPLTGTKSVAFTNNVANLLSSRFITKSIQSLSAGNGGDIGQYLTDVYCSAPLGTYADAAAFKAAMSGVELVYERATPLIYVLDEPIYLGYPVDDFGTEAKLPVDTAELPTGPIRYTVTYPFNAVDPLRRLPMNYISKESAQNLLNAMKSAGIIADFTMTYNATTQEYNFTITAPSDTPQSTNNETE